MLQSVGDLLREMSGCNIVTSSVPICLSCIFALEVEHFFARPRIFFAGLGVPSCHPNRAASMVADETVGEALCVRV